MTVEGNIIGLDASGTHLLGNGDLGIYVFQGGPGIKIGDEAQGAGNVISGNGSAGIVLTGTDGAVVAGNKIGTDLTGSTALGNAIVGININGSSDNTIGGTTSAARNIISGNGFVGVYIINAVKEKDFGVTAGANDNLVEGNYFGTDASGTFALANVDHGVDAEYDSSDDMNEPTSTSGNTIGGLTDTPGAGAGNVISGNTGLGVYLAPLTADTLIEGNLIGTNASGTAALGNGRDGIFVNSAGATIGGTSAGAANVISGNALDGIRIDDSSATLVTGNLIGTDFSGTTAVGNRNAGVEVTAGATNNTIGGSTSGARNMISGNTFAGILLDGVGTEGNVVAGNWIGTSISGDSAIPNGTKTIYYPAYNAIIGGGVVIEGGASGNRIGTDSATDDFGDSNLISGNDNDGIDIVDAGTNDNVVAGNLIGTNWEGATVLGNSGAGVFVAGNATGNTIGGGLGNVISGNSYGIQIFASCLVVGNLIGTNGNGDNAVANRIDGILVVAPGATIGGTSADAANVISGNPTGIDIEASCLLEGNRIGTNANGNAAIANSVDGILVNSPGCDDRRDLGRRREHHLRQRHDGVDIEGILPGRGQPDRHQCGRHRRRMLTWALALMSIASGATIGGTSAGAANVISGNSRLRHPTSMRPAWSRAT